MIQPETDDAEAKARIARESVERWRRDLHKHPIGHINLAKSLFGCSHFENLAGYKTKALEAIIEATALWREISSDGVADHLVSFAQCLHYLSLRLTALTYSDRALTAALEARDVWRELAQDNPGRFDSELNRAYSQLASCYWACQQPQVAAAIRLEALAALEASLEHRTDKHPVDLARQLSHAAAGLSSLRRGREAAQYYRRAIQEWRWHAARDLLAYGPLLVKTLEQLAAELRAEPKSPERPALRREAKFVELKILWWQITTKFGRVCRLGGVGARSKPATP